MFNIGTVTITQNGIISSSRLFQCWNFHFLASRILDQISAVTWVMRHMIFAFVGVWLEHFILFRETIMLITIDDRTQLLGMMNLLLRLETSILKDTGK